jgi:hypothetical protein
LRGGGEPGSRTDLGMLAQGTGLYATVFDTDPGAVLKAAPTDRLGPRYTITWRFPDPAGGKDRKLRQRVWPYAAGGPVSFTPAGQAVLDTTSSGGWYQGFDGLRAQLIELGLPNRKPLAPATVTPAPAPPAPAGPQPAPATAQPAAWPRVAAVVVGLLVLTAAAAVSLRRRRLGHGPATAP